MRAPLSAGHREAVLWQEGLEPRPPEAAGARPLPGEVDVAVVGGGYCGLSAAAALADAGRTVVLVERGRLGWGASTRNGGMVIPELKAGPRTLERRYGALGPRMHREVEAAFDHVESLVAGPPGGVRIDCGYERTGQLYLTHGPRGVQRLHRLAEEHRSIGSAARVVTGADLVAEAGSEHFAGGLVIERTGGLDPARFHRGLEQRARSRGVVLRERVAAIGLRRDKRRGGRVVVETTAGDVVARDVLLATNAHADDLDRRVRRRVLPMSSFIIATEPLEEHLRSSVLPTRRMAFDDRHLLWYWRHGPDGRLLFGGRRSLGPVSLDTARDHLYASMITVHPQLRGVLVDRVWGGEVALTLDRLPHCGVDRRVWHAHGCNGSGVALNTWLGHRMAGAILGGDLPAFAERRSLPIPLQRFRRAWLPLVGAWFEWSDRRDASGAE